MLDVNPETSDLSVSPDKLFTARSLFAATDSSVTSPDRPLELCIPSPFTAPSNLSAVKSQNRSSAVKHSQSAIPLRRATTGHASVRNSDLCSPYSPSFRRSEVAGWNMEEMSGWSPLSSGLSKSLYGFPLAKHSHKLHKNKSRAKHELSPPCPHHNNAKAVDPEQEALNHEMRRREVGWSTSFPAEYHQRYAAKKDLRETLAWQENQLRKAQLNDLRRDVCDGRSPQSPVAVGSRSPVARFGMRSDVDVDQSWSMERGPRSEVQVMKSILQRESLLEKLRVFAQRLNSNGLVRVEEGNRLLNLLLETRNASVDVIESIAKWQEAVGKVQFYYWSRKNYMVQMVTDLNFLTQVKNLSQTLHVNGESLVNNPFMMPSSITLSDLDAQKGAQKPVFQVASSGAGSPVKNSERAKYTQVFLLWCLANLEDNAQEQLEQARLQQLADNQQQQQQQQQQHVVSHHKKHGKHSSSPQRGTEADWRLRAETQLRLLSMPMETSTGISHVMDSSQILKRKGFLPALAMSPPKTLTELMDNVKLTERSIGNAGGPPRNLPKRLPPFETNGHDFAKSASTNSKGDESASTVFTVAVANGKYAVTSDDFEQLAQLQDAPPKSVSLVAATVLILLSPGDTIPREMSWQTTRKMFVDGRKLIERLRFIHSQAQEIADFKLQALRPFLSNEKFVPHVVEQDSVAAAALCAWVHQVIAMTQPEAKSMDGVTPQQHHERQHHDGDHSETHVETAEPQELDMEDRTTLLECLEDPREVHTSVGIGLGDTMDKVSNQHRKLLLVTRTWSHHNISYFVSFFYERHGLIDTLSIKMYEPMSSVESLVYMTQQDLVQDFGQEALDMFNRRDFGSLCELIMSRFNSIMGVSDGDASDALGSSPHKNANSSVYAATALVLSGGGSDGESKDHAALAIQCAARQRIARNKVHHLRKVKGQSPAPALATKAPSPERQRHDHNDMHNSAKPQQEEEKGAVTPPAARNDNQDTRASQRTTPLVALTVDTTQTQAGSPPKTPSPIASTQSLVSKMALAMANSSSSPYGSPSRPSSKVAPRPTSKVGSRPETSASYGSDFEAES